MTEHPTGDSNPCNIPKDLALLEVAAPFDGERAPWLYRANRERYGVGLAYRSGGPDSWTVSRRAARTKAEAMRDAKALLWDAPSGVASVTSWPSGAKRFYALSEEDRERARAHYPPTVKKLLSLLFLPVVNV